jgi:F0F1-type ATP synthase assembly protein I
MSELLSAAKGIKAVQEASEVLYIPCSILAIWSQFGAWLVLNSSGSLAGAIATCVFVGIIGCIAVHALISWTAARLYEAPVYPVLSATLIAIGLIAVFQRYMPIPLPRITEFSGVAFLAWGFTIDLAHDRFLKNLKAWRAVQNRRSLGRSV